MCSSDLNSIRAEETNTRSINIKQSDKKSKYSHKDRPKNKDDEKKKSETNYETTSNNDERKNPNSGNYNENDKKRKKRKKYVVYTETESSSTSSAKEGEIMKEVGKSEDFDTNLNNENQLCKNSSNENVDKDMNANIVSNLSIDGEDILNTKIFKVKNTKSAKEMTLEIAEEKKRKEERKKDKVTKMMNSNKSDEEIGNVGGEEGDEIEIDAEDLLDTDDVSRKGGRGTFSVGCLPKPLMSPKGNVLFPGVNMRFFFFFYL